MRIAMLRNDFFSFIGQKSGFCILYFICIKNKITVLPLCKVRKFHLWCVQLTYLALKEARLNTTFVFLLENAIWDNYQPHFCPYSYRSCIRFLLRCSLGLFKTRKSNLDVSSSNKVIFLKNITERRHDSCLLIREGWYISLLGWCISFLGLLQQSTTGWQLKQQDFIFSQL